MLGTGAIGCGAITSTGNISTSSASGTITAPSGGFLIGPYKNAATSSASITAAGVITGASLGLGTGAITCGAISSSGLITADGGLTVPSGDILTSNGTITCNGTITANSGLTLGNGFGITCGTTSYAPLSTQIGYFSSGGGTIGGLSTTAFTCLNLSNIFAIGVYHLNITLQIISWSSPTAYCTPVLTFTGIASSMGYYNIGGTASIAGETFSGPIRVTSATNNITMTLTMSAGTANLPAVSYSFVRIA